ncbi:SDR family NAD(P)-dependent oxidoreductase [Nocardioidaceae bacterium]|nr:SDR family NAD(P)-dependent oxidoreductase [Nocardioidaceae bacterium]
MSTLSSLAARVGGAVSALPFVGGHGQAWDLTGKVVLVTGGARGIGAAAAAELVRRGAVPVLADVDTDAAAATATNLADLGLVDPLVVTCDVTDLSSCEAAVRAAVERHGRLDIVWANAGIGTGGPVELMDVEGWARVVEVNLLGAFRTVRAALPAIIDAKGHVVVTCSLASFAHAPGLSAYAASKAGAEAFADSLRSEVAHQGVTVQAVHPTWIDTDMVRDGDEENDAFAAMRASLKPPVDKTYPLADVIPTLVDGMAARDSRTFLPGFVGLAFQLRNALNSRPLVRDQERAAKKMRGLFAAQVEREGARRASMGRRWS